MQLAQSPKRSKTKTKLKSNFDFFKTLGETPLSFIQSLKKSSQNNDFSFTFSNHAAKLNGRLSPRLEKTPNHSFATTPSSSSIADCPSVQSKKSSEGNKQPNNFEEVITKVKDNDRSDILLYIDFNPPPDSENNEVKAEYTKSKVSPTSVNVKGSSDNHVPAIPPPPKFKGKSNSFKHQKSIDLMDLIQDVESLTQNSPNASEVRKVLPSSPRDSSNIPSTIPQEQLHHSESMLPLFNCAMTSETTNCTSKVAHPNLTLPGLSTTLSPPEDDDPNEEATEVPYVPLQTPDFKIDLLESEGRRPSVANALSPTSLLPYGFPSIKPEDLTPEELHDFDMRWGSPHHARGRKKATRPTLLALPSNRPRVTSLPNRKEDQEEDEDEYYRLRQFSISGRRVVNRGDSFKSRRCKSNNSVASDVSSTEGCAWSHPASVGTSAASSAASSRASSASGSSFPFRVVILGSAGVGKTTLCHQFMTSEYINGYDNSLDDEYGEKSVSILLDGEESEIQLIDHPADEMSVENYLATYNPHAIIVVLSLVDRHSFVRAEEIIQYLWRLDVMSNKGVILVANKTDLVRNRNVSIKECSHLADSYDCKFIETSSGLNLKVDELLVGVVKQIRLKTNNPDESKALFRKRSSRRKKQRGTKTSASVRVKGLLTKVCGMEIKSKSCENLHVL